ncbi:MAG: (p)ppGpp synthetase, partial [Ruminiclostridium sp.]|nr:(p)ppGpp synthetase [Ruminiclostridium sp.]
CFIISWVKRVFLEVNIGDVLEALEAECHRSYIVPTVEFLKDIAAMQRFDSVDDFYAAIGYGGVKLSKIMQRIKDLYNSRQATAEPESEEDVLSRTIEQKQKSGVIVEGIDNCLIKFAKCCNPLPGDRIIGFITRGYGVSVHKQDCVNVINSDPQEKERWINVMWAVTGSSTYYSATIDIITGNISSALSDVTAVITGGRFPMRHVSANQLKNGNGNIVVTVEVASAEQLNALIGKIKKVPGVISAERTQVQ